MCIRDSPIAGGWINHHYKQVGYQLAAICATIAWTCVVTACLLLIMDRIPFLRLRLRPEEEELGTDEAQIGEFTYEDEATFIPEPIRSKSIAEAPLPNIDDHINTDNNSSSEATTEPKTAAAV